MPEIGTWTVILYLAEGTAPFGSYEGVETIELPLEVVADTEETAAGPNPTYNDLYYWDGFSVSHAWQTIVYNVVSTLCELYGGGGLGETYFDYIGAQQEALSDILATGEVSLQNGSVSSGQHSYTVSWRDGTAAGDAFVNYDRCIVSVVISPGVLVTDSAGGTVTHLDNGDVQLTWVVTRIDKRIRPGNQGSFTFTFEEPAGEITLDAAVVMLIGPFQAMPGTAYSSLREFPLIYNWSQWNADPSSVRWAIVGNDATTRSFTGTGVSRGNVNITVQGVAADAINASILYRGDYIELQRMDSDLGTAPGSATFTFAPVAYNTGFLVDAYCWDMKVGDTGLFDVSRPLTARTITANTMRPLTINAFYSDAATPLPGVTFRLSSWDGYRSHEHERATAVSGANGVAVFQAWPTTQPGERYILRGFYGDILRWEKHDVIVPNTSDGATLAATTFIQAPDGDSPVLVITRPADGSVVNVGNIQIVGTATDSGRGGNGIASVRVNGSRANNDTAVGSDTANWSKSVNLTIGDNEITVAACDNSLERNCVQQTIHITYTPADNPPSQPENVSPSGGALGVSLTDTLGSSPFVDPDVGDWHAGSQWQIRRASDSAIVFDSGDDAVNKTTCPLALANLLNAFDYTWQVRHKDSRGSWSEYSLATGFRTAAPTLSVQLEARNIVFRWPTNAVGFVLMGASELAEGTEWREVGVTPTVASGHNVVTISTSGPRMFYRLRKP